jgi:hypothetical protein
VVVLFKSRPGPETDGAGSSPPSRADHVRRRVGTGARSTLTVLAVAVVWFALVAPDRLGDLTPLVFLRIPVEALVVVTAGLYLPVWPRRVLAVLVGLLLGLLMVLRILDMGFFAALDRPFNPVGDWSYFGPAVGVLRDSVGSGWAHAAAVGALVLVVAVIVAVPLAVLRLTRLTSHHRTATLRGVAAFGLVWVVCAAFGAQFVSGQPIAARTVAGFAKDEVGQVRAALADRHTFAAEIAAPDRYRATANSSLLSALRGKDVILDFIESYGQVAVQGTSFSKPVQEILDSGTKQLQAAGFATRSAWLHSPTFGGISWLAHSTLQSGLWVNSEQRYDQLIDSNRFTLSDAFKRAGWHTVDADPANFQDWPPGHTFYHYDRLYDAHNVGYHGPQFSYANMPDQFLYEAVRKREFQPGHPPVMAQIDTVSSHTPWAPLPRMVPWNQLGDGSIFDPQPAEGQQPGVVWRHASQVRTAYGQSIQYSLHALISFVQRLDDPNLVLVVLGDHQPATIVSGTHADHDVPITIIAADPKVMDRISSWGWQPGMRPHPDAPVWPMSSFRNRFLSAFGS